MKNTKRFLTIFLTSMILQLQAQANDLAILALPEKAEVFVSSLQNKGTKVKVGETPFKMSLKDISTTYANGSEMYTVEVIKSGYEPYRVIIPAFIKADVNLEVNLQPKSELEEYKRIDKITNELFEIQRLIRAQNYDGAHLKVDALEKDYPKLSITKELKASALYLQNDYVRALDFFKQAYLANTENMDAYKMMLYLEKSLGVKKISGAEK